MDHEQDEGDDEQDLDENGSMGDEQEQREDAIDDLDKNNESFGSLRQRPARALDSRAAFLRGMPSYILYYWEVAESQQLLSSCLQRLSNQANAPDASSAALVSRRGGRTTSVRSDITSSGGSSRSGGRGSRRRNADEETDDDDEMTANKTEINWCSLFKTS
jgi:hypothetical protein